MMMRRGVVLVGGSGAGKSTILRALRDHFSWAPEIAFPRRFVTRMPRADDVSEENVSVTEQELDDLERIGHILLRWRKELSADAAAHYAFERLHATFAVLGGNDALLADGAKIRPSPQALDGYLRVLVSAPVEVRYERLSRRSPELNRHSDEWRVRMTDNEPALRLKVDMVVANSGGDPLINAAELVQAIECHVTRLG
ncbi:hypothetical protein [Micromonospora sp. CPCC 205561]|uniref:hypothetical protein n=1 Tax=Micromonospora sp. CPCC 205561 TaxID=3122407 RepID=UPI002FF43DFD